MNKDKIWKQVLDTIKISLSAGSFSTWFSQTFINNIQELGQNRQIVEIACPSPFIADGIEKRYFGIVQDALNGISGVKNELVFVVRQLPKSQVDITDNKTPYVSLFTQDAGSDRAFVSALQKARIRPGFTFENFAVSGSNQMAWAASDAVSKTLGTAYNPLFLWGGVGVGKTHLMLAVANMVLSENPDTQVLYCMGEEFTTEIVQAIRYKTTGEFKKRYRGLKLFLIDDVQFIAGKEKVQEEFFHTFNTLQRLGGQVILTSDRPPSEIQKLEERLRSRFEAGLIIDIAPPDFELRTAIALIKAKERGLEIDMEIAQLIAANIDSPRKIEGFITKLFTHSSLAKEEISIDLATNLLGKTNGDLAAFARGVSAKDFIEAVSEYYSIKKRRLLGTTRTQLVVVPRQVLMYLLRIELRLPLQEVGRVVGGRDHTTVMHAVEKISKNLSTNNQLRDDVLGIKKIISV